MFSDGLDGVERSLPDVGILLVAELLLEGLDGPVQYNVSKIFWDWIATGSPATGGRRTKSRAILPNPRARRPG
jgi:hypothetical protein